MGSLNLVCMYQVMRTSECTTIIITSLHCIFLLIVCLTCLSQLTPYTCIECKEIWREYIICSISSVGRAFVPGLSFGLAAQFSSYDTLVTKSWLLQYKFFRNVYIFSHNVALGNKSTASLASNRDSLV